MPGNDPLLPPLLPLPDEPEVLILVGSVLITSGICCSVFSRVCSEVRLFSQLQGLHFTNILPVSDTSMITLSVRVS